MLEVKQALKRLEDKGLNLNEDKAVFQLENGTLEIWVDEEEKTLKTQLHDMKTYFSNELNNRDMMSILFEISGIEEEDL
ncbi:hypothetical protein ABLW00_07945 [Staphylococcus equorum]